ncbi:hypothetical protein CYY_004552 [Polysphondylium violaceum]|uniref:Regulator of chromosome condensation domain-containing protein n=1 Tax=Polysphondylium violaceum TaxID=133409 RepID=A0A8J4PWQ6_9MYCE|nr:hypothetical protein CYY_004552 [Polysphondylium violaceum]
MLLLSKSHLTAAVSRPILLTKANFNLSKSSLYNTLFTLCGNDVVESLTSNYNLSQNQRYFYSTTTTTTTTTISNTNDGKNKVFSWGSGLNGKLCHGLEEKKIVIPKEIQIPNNSDSGNNNPTHITTGTTYSIIAAFDNVNNTPVLYGCGDNRDAQLIVGNGKIHSIADLEILSTKNTVQLFKDKHIVDLVSGTYHNVCRLDDGTCLFWGTSNSGQLGNPVYSRVQFDPYDNKLLSEIGIKKIGCGTTFTLALSNQGQLYSFGSSSFNELGNGDCFNERVPKKINNPLLDQRKIVDIAPGFFHNMVLDDQNTLLVWGRNQESQCFPAEDGIGKGSFCDVQILDTSILESDEKIVKIGSSSFNSYVLTDKGFIYSIGSNEQGQLGVGKSFEKGRLNKVNLPISVKTFYTGFKSIIVTDGERFFGWGSNFDHQLSLETRCVYFDPVELQNLNDLNKKFKIQNISISMSHTLSINSPSQSPSS